jgi:hypothetical protein
VFSARVFASRSTDWCTSFTATPTSERCVGPELRHAAALTRCARERLPSTPTRLSPDPVLSQGRGLDRSEDVGRGAVAPVLLSMTSRGSRGNQAHRNTISSRAIVTGDLECVARSSKQRLDVGHWVARTNRRKPQQDVSDAHIERRLLPSFNRSPDRSRLISRVRAGDVM